MEKKMETTVMRLHRVSGVGFTLENQMEKNMEHEMETGGIWGNYLPLVSWE